MDDVHTSPSQWGRVYITGSPTVVVCCHVTMGMMFVVANWARAKTKKKQSYAWYSTPGTPCPGRRGLARDILGHTETADSEKFPQPPRVIRRWGPFVVDDSWDDIGLRWMTLLLTGWLTICAGTWVAVAVGTLANQRSGPFGRSLLTTRTSTRS